MFLKNYSNIVVFRHFFNDIEMSLLNGDILLKFYFFQEQCFLANSSSIKEEPMDTVIGRDEIVAEIKSKDSSESHEDVNEQNEDNFAVG